MIGFNKPYLSGGELENVQDAVARGKLSGDGYYTKECQKLFRSTFSLGKCVLTTSCTDALEMAAILLDIGPGDEVILPSYNFVSAANAFIMRGATLVFADSNAENPNIDLDHAEQLITPKTKVLLVVHYAGVACDMARVQKLKEKHKLYIIEDAAHAIDAKYKNQYLGSFGDLATFSFHETKNIGCGEGGMLVINNSKFEKRAEIIWEKGTNRASFYRGEVNKYEWVDVGSSFLPSELNAAYLLAQIKNVASIQAKRLQIWQAYYQALLPLHTQGVIRFFDVPVHSENNAHMFCFTVSDLERRTALLNHLREAAILAVFHYLPLHDSPYFKAKYTGRELKNAYRYSDTIVRLPMFPDLSSEEITAVCQSVKTFFNGKLE